MARHSHDFSHTSRSHGRVIESLERRRLMASTSTLLSYDFETTAWATTPGAQSTGVTATREQGAFGTINTEGATVASSAVRLTTNTFPATGAWTSALTSGPLALSNTVSTLGKLTLGFNLSASQARPVTVYVTSFDAAGNRTGALAGTVIPAAANTYQRYAVDLSTMTASGTGTFNPVAPKIAFDFETNSANGWSSSAACQLRVDNVSFSKPAYYVSPSGNDNNSGLTEATAFRTPQRALTFANGTTRTQAGDIVLLMEGNHATTPYDYTGLTTYTAKFPVGGTPAAWVTMKNYPGQSPTIYSEYWNTILVGNGQSGAIDSNAAVAYVEVRGLHVVGGSAKVGSFTAPDGSYNPSAANADQYGPYAQYIEATDPRTNGNGLTIDGRFSTNHPHDIRFADNVVEDCAGGGISIQDTDRLLIENNVVRDNCYWDKYASSGISIFSAYDFEGTSNSYNRIVRNNESSGNIHKVKWALATPVYSDGNGIIIDINRNTTYLPNSVYDDRTLVTNNVTFNNGGSGIHSYKAYHTDIINNVGYLNSASPYLQYGQIFVNQADDCRVFNNIMVAPTAATGLAPEAATGGTKPTAANGISYKNNVYFGGNSNFNLGSGTVGPYWPADAYNVGNVVADPKFVAPSINALVANFRLQATSPAINLGSTTLLPPALDIAGTTRYGNPDSGAYEFVPAAPTALTLAAVSDTGVAGDNKTRFDNASAAAKISFTVTGTLSGASVSLFSGTTLLGTATASGTTTTVVTNGTAALPDGTSTITAVQTFAGSPSATSVGLAIAVDAVRPTLVGLPAINAGLSNSASRSEVRTVRWVFSEPMTIDISAITLTRVSDGQPVALSASALSNTGTTATLTLDTATAAFLANGHYQLVLLPAATDLAGNSPDIPGDGVSRFSFFKLKGDYDGSGTVDFGDFLRLQTAFGYQTTSPLFDTTIDHDKNGVIDFGDFLELQTVFGSSV